MFGILKKSIDKQMFGEYNNDKKIKTHVRNACSDNLVYAELENKDRER